MTDQIGGFHVKPEVPVDSLYSVGVGVEITDGSPGFWVVFRKVQYELKKTLEPPLLYKIH